MIQGIGYALYEARETDPRTGDILSGGMEDYRIPGIADTPPIDVHFDEGGFDHVLGGSVGIGEVATVPTSPAHRQRHPQRDRHPAHRDPDPARSPDRRAEREGRRMTSASMQSFHERLNTRPNSAPPAPISPNGGAAAFRAGS